MVWRAGEMARRDLGPLIHRSPPSTAETRGDKTCEKLPRRHARGFVDLVPRRRSKGQEPPIALPLNRAQSSALLGEGGVLQLSNAVSLRQAPQFSPGAA